jgi:hypothetical protein
MALDRSESSSWYPLVAIGILLAGLKAVFPSTESTAEGKASTTSGMPCADGIGRQPFCWRGESLGSAVKGSDLVHELLFDSAGPSSLRKLTDSGRLRVMIATLPDPVESHGAAVTDATLYAIRRAHEEAV